VGIFVFIKTFYTFAYNKNNYMNNQSFAEDFFLEIEHLIGEGKKYTSISKTIEMMWDLLDVPSQENIECCDQIFLTATNKSLPQGILIALITQSSHLRDSFKNREKLSSMGSV